MPSEIFSLIFFSERTVKCSEFSNATEISALSPLPLKLFVTVTETSNSSSGEATRGTLGTMIKVFVAVVEVCAEPTVSEETAIAITRIEPLK